MTDRIKPAIALDASGHARRSFEQPRPAAAGAPGPRRSLRVRRALGVAASGRRSRLGLFPHRHARRMRARRARPRAAATAGRRRAAAAAWRPACDARPSRRGRGAGGRGQGLPQRHPPPGQPGRRARHRDHLRPAAIRGRRRKPADRRPARPDPAARAGLAGRTADEAAAGGHSRRAGCGRHRGRGDRDPSGQRPVRDDAARPSRRRRRVRRPAAAAWAPHHGARGAGDAARARAALDAGRPGQPGPRPRAPRWSGRSGARRAARRWPSSPTCGWAWPAGSCCRAGPRRRSPPRSATSPRVP